MSTIEKEITEKIKGIKNEKQQYEKHYHELESYYYSQQDLIRKCDTIEKIDDTISLLQRRKEQLTKIWLQ